MGMEEGALLSVAGQVRTCPLAHLSHQGQMLTSIDQREQPQVSFFQVNYTITQATSVANLSMMYRGWRPWM